jgi:hypothetical protein
MTRMARVVMDIELPQLFASTHVEERHDKKGGGEDDHQKV